jgi:hypothetical protein
MPSLAVKQLPSLAVKQPPPSRHWLTWTTFAGGKPLKWVELAAE